jgi:uncharacterized protein
VPTPDAIAARLAGSPQERAAALHEAAVAGSAQAQALYGQLLLDGNGVTADRTAALGWFVRAAGQGHLMALNMVGRCYELGHGTAPDPARAAECYARAAERGLPEAMYNLATQLALGRGVAEDKAAAKAWLERAAALGFAKALNFLGSFAEDGWAGPVDLPRAADCYARAAAGGDFRAAFNHARFLARDGRHAAAVDWLRRAVAWGNPPFVAKLGAWLAGSPHAAFRAFAAELC